MKLTFVLVCLVLFSINQTQAQTSDFEKQVAASKLAAIREFPDLKDTTSSLFQYVQYMTIELPKTQPDYFKKASWPLELARACSQLPEVNIQQGRNKQGNENEDLLAIELAKEMIQSQDQQTIQLLETARALSRDARQIERIDKAIAMYRAMQSSVAVPQPRVDGNQLYAAPGSGHWIKENINRGEMILLEDGSLWKIDPLEKLTATLWLKISPISVAESNNGSPGFNYLLINTNIREKVHAQYVGKK